MATYRTLGSCSREIIFQVTDNKLVDVKFLGGCSGNLQAIARLVKGKDIDEVINILLGIRCRNNTSCPDQLAKALINYKNTTANPAPPEEDEEEFVSDPMDEDFIDIDDEDIDEDEDDEFDDDDLDEDEDED